MGKLTPKQIAVLRSIVEPQEGDEPFPPVNTVEALLRRGLVVLKQTTPNDAPMEIMMAAVAGPRIVPTDAGRQALEEIQS